MVIYVQEKPKLLTDSKNKHPITKTRKRLNIKKKRSPDLKKKDHQELTKSSAESKTCS